MKTGAWNPIVSVFVLAVNGFISGVSTQSVPDKFHSIKSPENVDLCATSTPSLVMSAKSKIGCIRKCHSQTVARCDGVNYDQTLSKCSIFFYRPRNYTTNMTSCQYLRRRSNEPCFNNPPTIYPIIDQLQCSFPFTLNGQLYYNCATNSSRSDFYNCQQFYCNTVNGSVANCLPPADFKAKVVNYTVKISGLPDRPTFSVFGWISFMLRKYGPSDGSWNLPWVNYTNGFGFNDTYLWLGLERVHQLTTVGNWRMRLEYFYSGKWVSAEYWTFTLGDSSTFYTISMNGYSGDDGNMLRAGGTFDLNGMQFSTLDQDHDRCSTCICSTNMGGGGWWYNWCAFVIITSQVPKVTVNGGATWPIVNEAHMMIKAR